MLYWVIWLATGIIFIGIFTISVLPVTFRGAREAICKEDYLKRRILRLFLFAITAATDVTAAVWSVATFFDRSANKFAVGTHEGMRAFIFLPVCVFAGVTIFLFAAGLFLAFSKKSGKAECLSKPIMPEEESEESKDARHKRMYSGFALAFIIVAILAATPVPAVMLDYLAVAKFNVGGAKKVLLLLVAGELVIAAIIGFFTRKQIKKYLRSVFTVISVLLLIMLVACYMLFMFAGISLIDEILIWGMAAVAIVIPLAVGAALFYGISFKNRLKNLTEV